MDNHATKRRTLLSAAGALLAAPALAQQAAALQQVPYSTGTDAPKLKALPFATDCHFHTYDRRYPAFPGATLLPEDASPDDYRALQSRIGTSRGVLITPSTYGTDNSLQLASRQALGPENFRVIAVVAEDVPDAELDINASHPPDGLAHGDERRRLSRDQSLGPRCAVRKMQFRNVEPAYVDDLAQCHGSIS